MNLDMSFILWVAPCSLRAELVRQQPGNCGYPDAPVLQDLLKIFLPVYRPTEEVQEPNPKSVRNACDGFQKNCDPRRCSSILLTTTQLRSSNSSRSKQHDYLWVRKQGTHKINLRFQATKATNAETCQLNTLIKWETSSRHGERVAVAKMMKLL
jgi:hypothetical protein